MRNIVFTVHMHPNEEVAGEMASLVADSLRQSGRTVEIIDLEKLRKGWRKPHWAKEMSHADMARPKLLLEAMKTHQGEFFDFHDSPFEGLQKRYGKEKPSLELTRSGYHLVETPAVYVSQEDPEISMHAEGERTVNRYFTRRSDVVLSREAGLLSSEMVDTIAGEILQVVERRDAVLK